MRYSTRFFGFHPMKKNVEKLWGGNQKILHNFYFYYFIDGYKLNDLQIVARCARSTALIRASGAGARMVTSDKKNIVIYDRISTMIHQMT